MFLCGSVVEHCVSSAKGCGFDSQGTHVLMKMYNLNAIVKSLWIKASDKCKCNESSFCIVLFYAFTGTGNMRSVCLSHNALGSTGFELLLKTLPMHCLTHLQLSAVCRGPSDQPAMEILTKLLTQVHLLPSSPV